MVDMSKWRHKDEWKQAGNGFLVVVSRHSVAISDDYTGPQRWCIYAYIYPAHPMFSSFSGPDMYQDAACALDMHAGPSLLNWHYNEAKEPTSVQVGCDYNHLHDEVYTHLASPEQAREVFADAQALFDRLSAGCVQVNEVRERE